MRKPLLVAAITVGLLAIPLSSTADTAAPAGKVTVAQARVNSQFAALARTLPVCGTAVTNCRYGTPAGNLQASVQSPTATIYFEMHAGVVTVLEVYPIH